MKIYTRTGDGGETSLFGGKRVPKSSVRIHAYGTIDELNAILGLANSFCEHETVRTVIEELQRDCFILGADLATPLDDSHEIQRICAKDTEILEAHIDRFQAELPRLTNFIFPGGSPCGASLHHARTVCRRAERLVYVLSHEEDVSPEIFKFLNRLSDLLFVMARATNLTSGREEIPWNRS